MGGGQHSENDGSSVLEVRPSEGTNGDIAKVVAVSAREEDLALKSGDA